MRVDLISLISPPVYQSLVLFGAGHRTVSIFSHWPRHARTFAELFWKSDKSSESLSLATRRKYADVKLGDPASAKSVSDYAIGCSQNTHGSELWPEELPHRHASLMLKHAPFAIRELFGIGQDGSDLDRVLHLRFQLATRRTVICELHELFV